MEGLRGLEWLIIPLLTLAGAALGVFGKGFYDSKFKKIDDAAKIRQELWAEVGHLRQVVTDVQDKYDALRGLIVDFDIALSRSVSRVEECVEVIGCLLEAEQHLDEGDVRKAKTILKLVENDKRMRDEMKLEARQNEVKQKQR